MGYRYYSTSEKKSNRQKHTGGPCTFLRNSSSMAVFAKRNCYAEGHESSLM